MSYSDNKAHFDDDKINIHLLYFLLLTSSTQFEEKHDSQILPEIKKTKPKNTNHHASNVVQKSSFCLQWAR